MLGPGLALASALIYGMVDYAEGVLSRRVHFAVVSSVGQLGGLLAASVAAFLAPTESIQAGNLTCGASSGIGGAVRMLFINRGVSRGALSTVVPISAVTGMALSVLCGVSILNERPGTLAWIGTVVVLPALWHITGGRNSGTRGAAGDGLLASCGVAVQYVGLGLASPASGCGQ